MDRSLIERMNARLAHRGETASAETSSSYAIGVQLRRVTKESIHEQQPIRGSNAVVAFDGRLDNRPELLADLRPVSDVTDDAPDSLVVLRAYETWGQGFAHRLNGEFAVAIADTRSRQLLLARDPVGTRPMYFYKTRDLVVFGSEIKAILAHPEVKTAPNESDLAEFLLGYKQTSALITFFQDIFSLVPGHLCEFRVDGETDQTFWDFDTERTLRFRDFTEFREAFGDTLRTAIRRRFRSQFPVAVLLSGGLDSSSIFCVGEESRAGAPHDYPDVVGITYLTEPGSPSDEREFLPSIEEQYKVQIHRVEALATVAAGAPQQVWSQENIFVDEQWSTGHLMRQKARELGARVVLSGHWGDQVLGSWGYLADWFRQLRWIPMLQHVNEYTKWFTDVNPKAYWRMFAYMLLRYHIPDWLFPTLRSLRARTMRTRNRILTESFQSRVRQKHAIRTVSHRRFANVHARSVFELTESKYYWMYMEMNNKMAAADGLDMAFPFIDRDLLQFMMSSPGEMQSQGGVGKAALRASMRGTVPDKILDRRWKADFSYLVNKSVHADFDSISAVVNADSAAVRLGYVNGSVLTEELAKLNDQMLGKTCDASWDMSVLYGLELWLRLFFENKGGRGTMPSEVLCLGSANR